MKMVALIPARAGSKRVPGKNTRLLGGKPLIQWTIEAAKASGVFADIACSTEDGNTGYLAAELGARFIERPREMAGDTSPDIEWVRHTMGSYPDVEAFAILRPTSPFRTAGTIRRAHAQFTELPDWFGSLRAVERWHGPHPAKMWYLCDDHIECVDDRWAGGKAPRHSAPTQSLPEVVRQNASLEMAWMWCVTHFGDISGVHVAPFFTEGDEGFDINTEADWTRAEQIIAARTVVA